ncbi:acetyltransferase [Paucilactobacillus hokkaidonensis JCM 18461]|uniref:Acetyltransferase n=2 Tax=Paucilactobacillus hokkaidonensis TaxID=1193095 RepID=A0A0A1GV29_9LACO|nr:GNAT family N-acetyltransferase [Paucilactobacillus hokkaidonensis]BAP84668.1 acetyltransferase [Paucilactobacillus hokkaidonensis JCM 18461]
MKVTQLNDINEQQLNQIMQIWLAGNEEAHSFVRANYWSDAFTAVKQQIALADIFVVMDAEKIIAFAGLADHYIAGLFVKRAYRDQGIGGAVIDYLQQNYTELELNVFEKNEAAFRFYQAHHFKIVEQKLDEETREVDFKMKWVKQA